MKIFFRNSDQSFWRFAFREALLRRVELVKRSYWFGYAWADTGEYLTLREVLQPGAEEELEIISDDLARSMWRNLHA